jgi:hypothetical protein
MQLLAPPRAPVVGEDLALELYREHTLLFVLAARLRETADRLERAPLRSPERLRTGLEVHRRFVLQVHLPNDELVGAALTRSRDAHVRGLLVECAAAHAGSVAFPEDVEVALAEPGHLAAPRPDLAALYRAEADRLETHHERESEFLYPRLDAVLSSSTRQQLLQEVLRIDLGRIGAEIALLSWAASLHPTSD